VADKNRGSAPGSPPPQRKGAGLLARLLLVAFGFGLALAGTEVALRVLAPNEHNNSGRLYEKDWDPAYASPRMLPNARAVHRGMDVATNSIGLRDREIAVPKPAETYRIVMLGDSFVFGQGIARLEDTLPKQLEARLKGAGHPEVEVVNSGVCGLNTFEEYMTYEHQARKLQPDMVILVWVAFDNSLNGYRESDLAHFEKTRTIKRDGRPAFRRAPDGERPPRNGDAGWVSMSYAATYLGRQLNGILADFGFNLHRDMDEQHERMDSEGYRLMYASLQSLARSCARDAVQLHVVIYPALRALDSPYYQDLIYSKLERRCARDGISCVNLFPAFRGRDPDALHVSIMDAHPNELANGIAADALAAELLARWPTERSASR
jgi:hypothetical protein